MISFQNKSGKKYDFISMIKLFKPNNSGNFKFPKNFSKRELQRFYRKLDDIIDHFTLDKKYHNLGLDPDDITFLVIYVLMKFPKDKIDTFFNNLTSRIWKSVFNQMLNDKKWDTGYFPDILEFKIKEI